MNPLLFTTTLILLVYRAFKGKGLTPVGILAAILTACVHGYHPWNLPFLLLITFYMLGTAATKVKHDVKARLTLLSTGAHGGEGARTPAQVFANSIVATVLTALSAGTGTSGTGCFGGQLLVVGIIANYAAATADTLSSELGILSRSGPRLITTFRRCPPGTNGGVSVTGTVAGALGAAIIGVVSVALLPFCADWTATQKVGFAAFVAAVGTAGSLLDSLLGALLQASVVDVRTGKVVEAPGGGKVLVLPSAKKLMIAKEVRSRLGNAPQTAEQAVGEVGTKHPVEKMKEKKAAVGKVEAEQEKEGHGPSRKVVAGWNVLSNNGVNFAMTLLTSAIAMAAAGWWWYSDVGRVVGEVMGACAGGGSGGKCGL